MVDLCDDTVARYDAMRQALDGGWKRVDAFDFYASMFPQGALDTDLDDPVLDRQGRPGTGTEGRDHETGARAVQESHRPEQGRLRTAPELERVQQRPHERCSTLWWILMVVATRPCDCMLY